MKTINQVVYTAIPALLALVLLVNVWIDFPIADFETKIGASVLIYLVFMIVHIGMTSDQSRERREQ